MRWAPTGLHGSHWRLHKPWGLWLLSCQMMLLIYFWWRDLPLQKKDEKNIFGEKMSSCSGNCICTCTYGQEHCKFLLWPALAALPVHRNWSLIGPSVCEACLLPLSLSAAKPSRSFERGFFVIMQNSWISIILTLRAQHIYSTYLLSELIFFPKNLPFQFLTARSDTLY